MVANRPLSEFRVRRNSSIEENMHIFFVNQLNVLFFFCLWNNICFAVKSVIQTDLYIQTYANFFVKTKMNFITFLQLAGNNRRTTYKNEIHIINNDIL